MSVANGNGVAVWQSRQGGTRLATRIGDKRVLKLLRSFLNSGVMIGGLEQPTEEGTPQGGPLSPISTGKRSNGSDSGRGRLLPAAVGAVSPR